MSGILRRLSRTQSLGAEDDICIQAIQGAQFDDVKSSVVDVAVVPKMEEWLPIKKVLSPLVTKAETFKERQMTFLEEETYVLGDIVFPDLDETDDPPEAFGPFYLRAGPFREVAFEPSEVKAAIVTCGGLCPGLNNIIREITMTLFYQYGVSEIYGIRDGYRGFYNTENPPILLTPSFVSEIHHKGGTVLGSSRGGMDPDRIMDAIIEKGFNQLFIIGGDGTHRGAQKIFDAAKARSLKIAVAGIPKTIDNDVPIIDRSFGFETSFTEAQQAIVSANVEAKCAPNCISIVKLMGRCAGFIALYATLASRDVNLCLIPEVKFRWEPLYAYVHERLLKKHHAVIVVAEGAGQDLCSGSGETDASGNVKLADIGHLIKSKLAAYFTKIKLEFNIKYIDPTYMIRSVAANASDSVYCSQLGPNAVHGLMAGYSGFSVGMVNEKLVLLPFDVICGVTQTVDPRGRMYQRMLAATGQPDLS